jgi:tRNA threonylcarbamoyladenosine biosynthesis protein TsaB
MKILSLDASGPTASAALCEGGKLMALSYADCGLKHSVTLLPMAEELLNRAGWTAADLDLLAVTHGPGSFTGLRIAVSTLKGLALANQTPCAGVSTLEAMAWRRNDRDGVICAMMDARRGEYYTAMFEIADGKPRRLTEDRALPGGAIEAELAAYGQPVTKIGGETQAGSAPLLLAYGAALAAQSKTPVHARELIPVYLRQSQAERMAAGADAPVSPR